MPTIKTPRREWGKPMPEPVIDTCPLLLRPVRALDFYVWAKLAAILGRGEPRAWCGLTEYQGELLGKLLLLTTSPVIAWAACYGLAYFGDYMQWRELYLFGVKWQDFIWPAAEYELRVMSPFLLGFVFIFVVIAPLVVDIIKARFRSGATGVLIMVLGVGLGVVAVQVARVNGMYAPDGGAIMVGVLMVVGGCALAIALGSGADREAGKRERIKKLLEESADIYGPRRPEDHAVAYDDMVQPMPNLARRKTHPQR